MLGTQSARKIAPVTSESHDGSHRRKYVKLQVLPKRIACGTRRIEKLATKGAIGQGEP